MINPNEPAFLELQGDHDKAGDIYYKMSGGLTKREYMAIQFMASRLQLWCIHTTLDEDRAEQCAKETILAVDALIAELNKTTTE